MKNMSINNILNITKSWWVKLGFFSVLDQAIFSLTNFTINILMARWLDSFSYGVFAILIAVFIVSTSVHNSLILEPMSIFGTLYLNRKRKYFLYLMALHFLYGFTFLLIVISYLKMTDDSKSPLLILAFLQPFMLLPWLIRRFYYLESKVYLALVTSSIYFLSTILFFYLFKSIQTINAQDGLICMCLGGALSALIVLFNNNNIPNTSTNISLKKLIRCHFEYGKWIMFSNFLLVAVNQGFVFLAATQLGVREAGVFKALSNFILPAGQIFSAMTILVIPILSKDFYNRDYNNLLNKGKRISRIIVLLALLNETILILFRYDLLRILYDGKYLEYVNLIPILGIAPIIVAFYSSRLIVLKTVQLPKYESIANVVASAIAFCLAIWFTRLWKLNGLVFSMLLMYCTIGVIIFIAFYKQTKSVQKYSVLN